MSIPGSANPLLLASAAAAGGYAISRSLRFNSAHSAYLSWTPASAGNRKTWTWAGWVKRSGLGSGTLFSVSTTGTPASDDNISFDSSTNSFQVQFYESSTLNARVLSASVFRDVSAWYHFVVSVDTTQAAAANRIKVYANGSQITSFSTATYPSQNYDSGYSTTNRHSIGRNDGNATAYFSGYLADVHFIDGQALDPTSFGEFDTNGIWQPKAYSGSYGTNGFHLTFSDNSTAGSLGDDSSGNSNNWDVNNLYVSTESLPGYASVVGAGTNPGYMFDLSINSAATGSPNSDFTWNGSINLGTGKFYAIVNVYSASFQGPFNVYLTVNGSTYITVYSTLRSNSDIHNQQIGLGGVFTSTADGRRTDLTPSVSSATLTRVYCTATGGGFSNSVYAVVFVPSGVSDTDFANHVVVHNVSPEFANDSFVDVPTSGTETDTGLGGEVRGNYCTLNPLNPATGVTFSNGNLDVVISNTPFTWRTSTSTVGISPSTGSWYWEVTINFLNNYSNDAAIGIAPVTDDFTGEFESGSGYVYEDNGNKMQAGSASAYGATYGTGDVIGVAYNSTSGSLVFYKNGASQGTAFTVDITKTYYAIFGSGNVTSTSYSVNFGQRPFAYTAPSGFKALCTANLPPPVITKPSEYMDVKLYTGNGSTQTISGLEFSPDLVWIKNRAQADNHKLLDTVRGATEELESNTTDAEVTNADGLTAFNSDGFDLGADVEYNTSTEAYVAWTWDAGSSTVPNTDGSITSQVRANASAGFSIVSYDNPTWGAFRVGHGLGVAPEFVIVKARSAAGLASFWFVWHIGIPGTSWLNLSGPDAAQSNPSVFSAAPTSTSIYLGSGNTVSNYGSAQIAYCFAPVEGYSAFGSYTGNGSTDGPFIYTGFRPRWILIKSASGNFHWTVWDAARDPENAATRYLYASDSNSEVADANLGVDLLSNGFKIHGTDQNHNGNANNHIYAAFAENPFALNARAR